MFLVALAVSPTILDAPFWGQDELLVLDRVVKANRAIGEGNIRALINIFLRDDHPPAPTLIAMPFVWLLGPTGLALRLPHCLLWGLVCAFAASLGMKLGGLLAGVATGLLLAVSGLFNVFAMEHGHSGEVLFVFALLLRHDRCSFFRRLLLDFAFRHNEDRRCGISFAALDTSSFLEVLGGPGRGWSTVGHVRTYTQDSDPYQLLQSVQGHVYWQNNREAPPGPPARRE